ncbi:O-antigen ligase family protein [Planctomicrobium sp. SH664]|uniref:O-antigen ligase family protein n=1 Tax=Planctomicrobium sp. SH664 TaxID=3448125 RepID=UPI003F5AFE5F
MAPSRSKPAVTDPLTRCSGWEVLLAGTFLIRYFVPPEGSDLGHNLWIALLWLALAAGRCWWMWRNREPLRWNWTLLDTGVCALIAGHVLSAGVVLLTSGDKRATLNWFWEWGSFAATWGLLRRPMQSLSFRQLVSAGLLTTMATVAGVGLWQYAVMYPAQAADAREFLTLHERLERQSGFTSSERQRYERLKREIGSELLAHDEAGRRQLMDRIAASVEPIGLFALANTLGALLGVGLVLFLDQLWKLLGRERPLPALLVLGTFTALIAYCLLLTKSRAAWVGTALALAWLFVRWAPFERFERKKVWGGMAGAAGIVALMVGIAFFTGGLDREVLDEALTKSLGYRLEYWRATWQLIQDHVVLGIGPGNFRQAYLQYKLPGASEEILDPHNSFLDVWANGGLLGFCGLILISVELLRRMTRTAAGEESSPGKSRLLLKPVCLAGSGALALILIEQWMFHGRLDGLLLCLLVIFPLVAGLLLVVTHISPTGRLAALAGCAGLSINLLAAGGISMPAILQLMLFLLWIAQPEPGTAAEAKSASPRVWLGLTLGSGATVAACLLTGLIPALTVSELLEQGKFLLITTGNERQAEECFAAAIESDPLAAEPHQSLVNLYSAQWDRRGRTDRPLFDKLIEHQRAAIDCDPQAAKRYYLLGKWWLEEFDQSRDPVSAEQGLAAFQNALARYPNDALINADYAIALAATGQNAQRAAARGLELDDLNRARGHIDRFLPEVKRSRLEELAAVGKR